MPPDSTSEADHTPPAPLTPGQKSVATIQRHRDERRAEKLRDIRSQTEDGSLTIRYLTGFPRPAEVLDEDR
jgi:hypothetical protein